MTAREGTAPSPSAMGSRVVSSPARSPIGAMGVGVDLRLKRILEKNGNRCCDCDSRDDVTWASIAFGSLHCLMCAGRHRQLGVHITFVQSMTMDLWDGKEDNLAKMEAGSNKDLLDYLEALAVGKEGLRLPRGHDYIHELYTHPAMIHYKETLRSRIDGLREDSFSTASRRGDYDAYEQLADVLAENEAAAAAAAADGGGGGADGAARHADGGPVWSADRDNAVCSLCGQRFSLFVRRHHCRRCGACVCVRCAPAANTRPIHEWNLKAPVRHCKKCYRSPALNFVD